jgi:hypothetical protein
MKSYALRLDEALHQALVNESNRLGLSLNQLIGRACQEFLGVKPAPLRPYAQTEPPALPAWPKALPPKTQPIRAAGPPRSCPHHIGAGGRCGKCPDGVAS